MKKSLTRSERLTRSSDINRVFSRRQSVSCNGAKLFCISNSYQWNRFVCIPARGFKRAVDRNRVRRHVKEIVRQEKPLLRTGFDMVFLIYPGMDYDYSMRKQQIISLLKRAGLYQQQDMH